MSFNWSDYASAERFRSLVRQIVLEVLGEKYPPQRLATVQSYSIQNRTATVIYNGETEPVKVKLRNIYPAFVGQDVFIGGQDGDKYVTDCVGKQAGTLAPIFIGPGDFTEINSFGTFEPSLGYLHGVRGIYMENTSTDYAHHAVASVSIPPDWGSYNVDLFWIYDSTSAESGDWLWTIQYSNNYEDGIEVLPSGADAPHYYQGTVSARHEGDHIHVDRIIEGSEYTGYRQFEFGRYFPSDPQDTLAFDVLTIGMLFTPAS